MVDGAVEGVNQLFTVLLSAGAGVLVDDADPEARLVPGCGDADLRLRFVCGDEAPATLQ